MKSLKNWNQLMGSTWSFFALRLTLAYFSINLLENYRFSFKKTRIAFLIFSSLSYYMPKRPTKKNTDTYKSMAKKDLLAQYLKTSIKKRALLLAMLHHIYWKKRNNWVILENSCYNKQPTNHWQ